MTESAWVAFHQGDDSDNPQAVWSQPSMDDKVGVTRWHTLPETSPLPSGPVLQKKCGSRVTTTKAVLLSAQTALILPVRHYDSMMDGQKEGEVAFDVKWKGDSEMIVLRQHTRMWQQQRKKKSHNPFTCLTSSMVPVSSQVQKNSLKDVSNSLTLSSFENCVHEELSYIRPLIHWSKGLTSKLPPTC